MTRTNLEQRIDKLLTAKRPKGKDIAQTLIQFAKEYAIEGRKIVLSESAPGAGIASGIGAYNGQIIDWAEASGTWVAYASERERAQWPVLTPYDLPRLNEWATNDLRYGGRNVRAVLRTARDYLQRGAQ